MRQKLFKVLEYNQMRTDQFYKYTRKKLETDMVGCRGVKPEIKK